MAEHDSTLVQQQFADRGEAYARSTVHAKGASLARLVELVQPQPDWRMLDIATGAGHTALAFAPHLATAVATDVTVGMLQAVKKLAGERGATNLYPAGAAATALPFPSRTFHLVTCRIAPHHFADPGRFVQEVARVLRPGGRLALVDNIVPGGRKKREAKVGDYVNAFERLRDPSHVRCLSVYEWRELFWAAGLTLEHEELLRKEIEFNDWAARMKVFGDDRVRLQAMLVQAPGAVLEFLTPVVAGDRITFCLTEGLFIAGAPQ